MIKDAREKCPQSKHTYNGLYCLCPFQVTIKLAQLALTNTTPKQKNSNILKMGYACEDTHMR